MKKFAFLHELPIALRIKSRLSRVYNCIDDHLLPIQTHAIESQMTGKQAKILNDDQLARLLAYVNRTRYPVRIASLFCFQ